MGAMTGPSWFEAYDVALEPLFAARGLLDALSVAAEQGMLESLRSPTSEHDLVAGSGLAAAQVRSLVEVLDLGGVVRAVEPSGWQLTEVWLALTGPDAFTAIEDTLAASDVDRAAIRSLGSSHGYGDIDAAARLSYAKAISPNPFNEGAVARTRAVNEADPDVEVLRAGGLALELGCGVAGRILTALRGMPRARAVGVELAPDLADEARRRAVALGCADRFEVVVGDAADFHRPAAFDSGFWSQFFFPEGARAGALRTALDCLRPGAVLRAPLLGDPEEVAADPRGEQARSRAAMRIVLGAWGVPDRTPDELVAEIADAGFVDVAALRLPHGGWGVRAVRP